MTWHPPSYAGPYHERVMADRTTAVGWGFPIGGSGISEGRKEWNVLFNDAFNTFYLWLYGFRHKLKNHSGSEREETRYSFRLAARVLLYESSHRQDRTYHSLCYTSRGALTGTRNSSMGPPHEGSTSEHWHEGRKCFI